VKDLPIFSILKSIGFEDSTSDRIWHNGNMRLYNSELDMNGPGECITIYGNGPIRKTVSSYHGSSSPHILKRFPPIQKLEDWNLRFFYILEWAKKRYKSRHNKIIDYSGDHSDSNFGKVIEDVYKSSDPEKFLLIYRKLSDREKGIFLKQIEQKEEDFEKYMNKYLEIKKKAFLI
jgi:hypothetical protein